MLEEVAKVIYEQDLLKQVEETGKYLVSSLEEAQVITINCVLIFINIQVHYCKMSRKFMTSFPCGMHPPPHTHTGLFEEEQKFFI